MCGTWVEGQGQPHNLEFALPLHSRIRPESLVPRCPKLKPQCPANLKPVEPKILNSKHQAAQRQTPDLTDPLRGRIEPKDIRWLPETEL